MSNPAQNVENLISALVTKLKAITGLVTLLNSDSGNIYAFDGPSLQHAIEVQVSPSVMVAWRGTVQDGRGGFATYRHDVSVFLRTNTDADWPTMCGYVTKGVPTSGTLPMDTIEIDASCDPMDDLPTVTRQTDSNGIDYFEISMSFKEK